MPQASAATSTSDPSVEVIQKLSDITEKILQECLKRDLGEFYVVQMAQYLSCKTDDVEKALTELMESGLMVKDVAGKQKTVCRLTAAGKSYTGTLS